MFITLSALHIQYGRTSRSMDFLKVSTDNDSDELVNDVQLLSIMPQLLWNGAPTCMYNNYVFILCQNHPEMLLN